MITIIISKKQGGIFIDYVKYWYSIQNMQLVKDESN